ncbi:type II toxin-antitoxin system RelE/ParE family toxin [Sulfuriferula sp.]|uniref:type II toxin-antitoxin system RelE/ParE family toxin n=1 Tax=Sulfuriferula sp. TaxID=2025307 RepID=UPI002730A83D|nr:type II toxin-antitoxin system RelE/ParE family toxin [Sulfuriferula sp.]MDP2025998.1 type II toxin-antitoxin system RelE/ParE family toxin [Sulfuriferula sp.]
MRVIWTPEAQQDRADVWDFIAADDPRVLSRGWMRFLAMLRLDWPNIQSLIGQERFPAPMN